MTEQELIGKKVEFNWLWWPRKVLAVRKVQAYPFKTYARDTWQVQVYFFFPFKEWRDVENIHAIL